MGERSSIYPRKHEEQRGQSRGAPHLPRPVERLEQSGERGTPYLLRELQIKPDGRGTGDRTCTPGSRELEETCEGQGIPHQHR